jgi:phenylacetate-CoA ligase
MIAGLEGRTSDLLMTSDGRRVFWLNPVFYGLPVRQSQIVQETPRRIRARFVPAPEFADSNGETIVERLRKRLGDLEIVLEPVAELPRSSSGKVRHVIRADNK